MPAVAGLVFVGMAAAGHAARRRVRLLPELPCGRAQQAVRLLGEGGEGGDHTCYTKRGGGRRGGPGFHKLDNRAYEYDSYFVYK